MKLNDEQERLLNDFVFKKGNIFGRDKTFYSISHLYPDEHISKRAIADWQSHQEIFQRWQRPVMSRGIVRPQVSKQPGYIQLDTINMESAAYNGYKYIINAVDVFSKFYWGYAAKADNSANVIKAMETFMDNGMKVSFLQHDNGAPFISDEFTAWKDEHSIKSMTSKAHSPWSNGVIESRGGNGLKRLLFMWMKTKGSKDWVSMMPQACKNLNTTMSFATKESPQELQFDDTKWSATGDRLESAASRRYKGKVAGKDLSIGQLCRIRLPYDPSNIKKASKLGFWSEERYRIIAVVHNRKHANITSSYRIENVDTNEKQKGLYQRGLILPIPDETVPLPRQEIRPGPDENDGYEVESIIDKKIVRRGRSKKGKAQVQYLVRWAGYTNRSDTWEPIGNLENAQDAINDYEREHG